jgi:hypothetical protein
MEITVIDTRGSRWRWRLLRGGWLGGRRADTTAGRPKGGRPRPTGGRRAAVVGGWGAQILPMLDMGTTWGPTHMGLGGGWLGGGNGVPTRPDAEPTTRRTQDDGVGGAKVVVGDRSPWSSSSLSLSPGMGTAAAAATVTVAAAALLAAMVTDRLSLAVRTAGNAVDPTLPIPTGSSLPRTCGSGGGTPLLLE